MRLPLWTALVLISGAASVLAVRLANPSVLDELLTTVAIFFVLPFVLFLILNTISRVAAVIAAIAMPGAWLLIARGSADSALLSLIPIVSALVIAVIYCTRGAPGTGHGAAGSRHATLGSGHSAATSGRRSAFVLLPALAVAVTILLAPTPRPPHMIPRVLLIGIDGASWGRVEPLVADGRLPNLERLIEHGHTARLRTLPSMYSPQIWSTIATGCLPDDHGIYDFGCRQADFRVGRLWDRMWVDGRSCGLCGWYFTWPPNPHLGQNDFVVPSTLAPDGRTYPPDFSFYWQLWARESFKSDETVPYHVAALKAFRNGVRLSTLRRAVTGVVARKLSPRAPLEEAWRNRQLSAALETDVFCELLRTRRPEFAAILLNQVDKVSHLYWKYMEPEGFEHVSADDQARYSGVIDELYVEIDACLAKILDVAPLDAEIVVVSDHGFRPALRRTAGRFCRIRTENLIKVLGMESDVFGTNVDRVVHLRPTAESEPLREAALNRLEARLADAHLSDESVPFFTVTRDGPSLCLEIKDRNELPPDARLVIGSDARPVAELVAMRIEARFSGEHHPDGVFILAGPSSDRATVGDSLHVLDVAPTVAALLDLPSAPNWTGRPAIGNLSPEALAVAVYPAPSASVPANTTMDEALKEKLRAMGYLE